MECMGTQPGHQCSAIHREKMIKIVPYDILFLNSDTSTIKFSELTRASLAYRDKAVADHLLYHG